MCIAPDGTAVFPNSKGSPSGACELAFDSAIEHFRDFSSAAPCAQLSRPFCKADNSKAERVCGLVAVPPKHSQTARTRHDMPRRYTYASSWLHSGVSAHDHGLPTLPMRVRPGCQNSKRNLVSVRAKLIYGLWSLHSGNRDGPIASADEFGEKSVSRAVRVVDRPSL